MKNHKTILPPQLYDAALESGMIDAKSFVRWRPASADQELLERLNEHFRSGKWKLENP